MSRGKKKDFVVIESIEEVAPGEDVSYAFGAGYVPAHVVGVSGSRVLIEFRDRRGLRRSRVHPYRLGREVAA